jgi:hypothetical protein
MTIHAAPLQINIFLKFHVQQISIVSLGIHAALLPLHVFLSQS